MSPGSDRSSSLEYLELLIHTRRQSIVFLLLWWIAAFIPSDVPQIRMDLPRSTCQRLAYTQLRTLTRRSFPTQQLHSFGPLDSCLSLAASLQSCRVYADIKLQYCEGPSLRHPLVRWDLLRFFMYVSLWHISEIVTTTEFQKQALIWTWST